MPSDRKNVVIKNPPCISFADPPDIKIDDITAFHVLFRKECEENKKNGISYLGMPNNIREYLDKRKKGIWQTSSSIGPDRL